MSSIVSLPADILTQIAEKMRVPDFLAFRETCKSFRDVRIRRDTFNFPVLPRLTVSGNSKQLSDIPLWIAPKIKLCMGYVYMQDEEDVNRDSHMREFASNNVDIYEKILQNLDVFSHVKHIHLTNCLIETVPALSVSVTKVQLYNTETVNIQSLLGVSVVIINKGRIVDFSPLREASEISLENTGISDVSMFKAVTGLRLKCEKKVKRVSNLENVDELTIHECPNIKIVENMPKLSYAAFHLFSPNFITNCPRLQHADFVACGFEEIPEISHVKTVEVKYSSNLKRVGNSKCIKTLILDDIPVSSFLLQENKGLVNVPTIEFHNFDMAEESLVFGPGVRTVKFYNCALGDLSKHSFNRVREIHIEDGHFTKLPTSRSRYLRRMSLTHVHIPANIRFSQFLAKLVLESVTFGVEMPDSSDQDLTEIEEEFVTFGNIFNLRYLELSNSVVDKLVRLPNLEILKFHVSVSEMERVNDSCIMRQL